MATFTKNIANIRGDAVYGTDVRESIAQAIIQSVGFNAAQLSSDTILLSTELISGSDNDYILTVTNAQ